MMRFGVNMKKIKHLIGDLRTKFLFNRIRLVMWLIEKLERGVVDTELKLTVSEYHDDGTVTANMGITVVSIGNTRVKYYPYVEEEYTFLTEEEYFDTMLTYFLEEEK